MSHERFKLLRFIESRFDQGGQKGKFALSLYGRCLTRDSEEIIALLVSPAGGGAISWEAVEKIIYDDIALCSDSVDRWDFFDHALNSQGARVYVFRLM